MSEPNLKSHIPHPAPEAVIALSRVGVVYQRPTERVATMKEHFIRRLMGRQVEYRKFHALKDVSLEVQPGDALGIVGRNGAGKSTLLRVIARVIRPTQGRVIVRGRISPLIELGIGFNMEMTGRENLYLSGALLGFSRGQMREKFEEIVAFSGLEPVIDSPLRMYSSGMVVRLGFAIASSVDPDILMIDEALAVGDAEFQEKCLRRIDEFRRQKVTILFVSHSAQLVRSICTRAIWLEAGEIRASGGVDEVLAAYQAHV